MPKSFTGKHYRDVNAKSQAAYRKRCKDQGMVQLTVFMLPSSMAVLRRLRRHWRKTRTDTLGYLFLVAEQEVLESLNDQERDQYYAVCPEHRIFS
ncbi:MAG: hypothetical protein ACR2PT_04825 [Endozoicomonas sp.]